MFSALLGNNQVKQSLIRMYESKSVPNTLLFLGPDGVGKKQFALLLAALLMGEKHKRRVLAGSHPDVHLYAPEGKLAMHSMASMKSLIDEVGMPPFEAPCKVFIVEEAERMLPSSSNALLKTFEEPTLDSYIILLSSEPESLLPTIVSRCRKVSFFAISEKEIASYLVSKFDIPEEKAYRAAVLSHGSLTKACSLIEIEESKLHKPLMSILTQLYNLNFAQLQTDLSEIEEILERKKEDGTAVESLEIAREVDLLLEKILYWFRDVEKVRVEKEPSNLFYTEFLQEIKYCVCTLKQPYEHIYEEVIAIRKSLRYNVKIKNSLQNFFLKIT